MSECKSGCEAGTIEVCAKEYAKLIDEIEKLKADWNQQAQFWNSNTLRDSAEIRSLKSRVAELESELLESSRLHGIGSEREARLMARVAENEKLTKVVEDRSAAWDWCRTRLEQTEKERDELQKKGELLCK